MAQEGIEMLGSMYSAVSGLSAHQTKMNVIGNNIANVNTYGFKSSRVTFTDVFYQTMSGASSPTSSAGGTNPTQLGYGAMVKSIDVINTRAGSATTDRPLDVYINGEGYLPVKDSGGIIKYTRVGVLSFDVSGNLVDSSGNMVLGVALDQNTGKPKLNANGTVSAKELVPIKVDPKEMDKFTGIAISSKGEITAIKEGAPAVVPAANTGWLYGAEISPDSIYSGNIIMTATRSDEISVMRGNYPVDKITGIGIPNNADISGSMSISRSGSNYTLSYKKIDGTTDSLTASLDTASNTVTFKLDDNTDSTLPKVDFVVNVGEDRASQVDIPDGESLVLGTAVVSRSGIFFQPESYPVEKIAEGALDISEDANINGAISLSNEGGNIYKLTYTNMDGVKETITGVYDNTNPAMPFVAFSVPSSKNPLVDVPVTFYVGEDRETQLDVPVGGSLAIGNVVAAEIKIDATTFDKSGNEVKLSHTWKPGVDGDDRIKLGDMNLTIDSIRFGTIKPDALDKTVVGTIGPGAGVPTKIANLAIVNFTNADGLSQSGEGYYVETENSGQPVGTVPGDMGTGSLRSGALEMSNVDLSREFTEMIIAQRGFQANTRMITVSDEMLSELVNMKR